MSNFVSVLIIWIWTVVAWLLNYFYHPLALKFLSIEEFAEFESLISIFNILWVLASGLSLFLVKEISKSSSDISRVRWIFVFSNKYLLILWCFLYFVYILFSPLIAKFLHFPSVVPVILIWVTIILTFQSIVVGAVLQWLKKFKFISFTSFFWPLLKIGIWLSLFYLWYKLYWTIFSFLLSTLFVVVLNFIYILKFLKSTNITLNQQNLLTDFKSEKNNILHFFILTVLLSVYMNFDILFAKNLFNWELAWIYSALSVVWKFLVFVFWAVETVYYPQIMSFKKIDLPKHFIKNSFFMMVLLWTLSILWALVLWTPVLNIMKSWLWNYNNLFLLVLVFCVLYGFISFYSKILMWWWVNKINYILWGFLLILVWALYSFWTANLYNFIYVFIGVMSLLLCSLLYVFVKRK